MAQDSETNPSTSSSDHMSSQDSSNNQPEVSSLDGLKSPTVNIPAFPIIYPALVPGMFPPHQDQEQINHGRGLFAVPVVPHMHTMFQLPSNAPLIPFTYNIPASQHGSPEVREVGTGREPGQPGEQPQQAGAQRQVAARRFQIAIHLDLLLILKLAAVIFLFNHDGSKQRLTLLVLLASLVYLYQTGALAPLIRWLSQGMQRAAAPRQPPRPGRADNVLAAGGQGNENAGIAGEENENEQVNGNRGIENDRAGAGRGEMGNNPLRVILKEIQMLVFGFITSLLPGFHNID